MNKTRTSSPHPLYSISSEMNLNIYGKIVNSFNTYTTHTYIHIFVYYSQCENGKHGNDAAALLLLLSAFVDVHIERLDELCVIFLNTAHHKINYTSTILFQPNWKLINMFGVGLFFKTKAEKQINIQTNTHKHWQ